MGGDGASGNAVLFATAAISQVSAAAARHSPCCPSRRFRGHNDAMMPGVRIVFSQPHSGLARPRADWQGSFAMAAAVAATVAAAVQQRLVAALSVGTVRRKEKEWASPPVPPSDAIDFLLNLERLQVVKLGLVRLELAIEAVLDVIARRGDA